MVKSWNSFPTEAVKSPSLEIFKMQMDMFLGNLLSALSSWGLDKVSFQVQLFCDSLNLWFSFFSYPNTLFLWYKSTWHFWSAAKIYIHACLYTSSQQSSRCLCNHALQRMELRRSCIKICFCPTKRTDPCLSPFKKLQTKRISFTFVCFFN